MNFLDSLLAQKVNKAQREKTKKYIHFNKMESPIPGEEEGGEACSSEFVLESPATVRQAELEGGRNCFWH